MTRHALVIAAFLLLCGCSIGEPFQLSSCETSTPGPNCSPKETCAGQCVVVPPLGGWEGRQPGGRSRVRAAAAPRPAWTPA